MRFILSFLSSLSLALADDSLMIQLGFSDLNDFNLYMGILGIFTAFVLYKALP
jgi:hypothetical protein